MPASHRGRVHGLMEVTRIGVMSGYQMLIGVIYKNSTPTFTWSIVLMTGALFLGLTGILAVKDKRRYKNLYRV